MFRKRIVQIPVWMGIVRFLCAINLGIFHQVVGSNQLAQVFSVTFLSWVISTKK
jgi:hypothetical protein